MSETMIRSIFNYLFFRFFQSKNQEPPPQTIVLERYGDFQEIGQWGVFNTETGESEIKGNMVSETVKYMDKDCEIKFGTDWLIEKEGV